MSIIRTLKGWSHGFDWNSERRRVVAASERRERKRPGRPQHLVGRCEWLEDRCMLSFVWANRGDASDMFDAAFGANAELGRGAVDSALAEWNRVVTGYQGQNFNVQMTIAMDPTNPATSAFASSTVPDANGVPILGNVTINMALDAGGNTQWYLDPTPDDHSEFMGSLVHAFARNPTPGGPADGMRDLRTLLIHELGHTMGVYSGSELMYSNPAITMTNTGITDNSVGAGDNSYWLFQGPSVNAVMTDFDINGPVTDSAGHTAMPLTGNAPVNFNGQSYYTAVDTMQPTSLSIRRILLTNKVGLMMQDMGYDVVMPETFGTFHSVLDTATGLLTIQGGNDNTLINNVNQGASSDTISLLRFGNFVVVSIDVGVDVPGSGPGMTAQDQQDAFLSVFSIGDVNAIRIEGFDGNDQINFIGDFDFLSTLRVFGGDGNDSVSGAAITGNQALMAFGDDGNDVIAGDGNNDTLLGANGNDLIRGGGGNDQLGGGNGHDILLGERGDDVLTGGAGRDVLIGGRNADRLVGGADDDILIAGMTLHDANAAALNQILAEWSSPRDYPSRVLNLKGIDNPEFNNRLNGNVFLRKGPTATVLEDDAQDFLTGSGGKDWFLFDPALDVLVDRLATETMN